MPYFKNKDVNLLFIHIPKTGGSSLEIYFSKKYSIKLCMTSLFEIYRNIYSKILPTSPQHLTYNKIYKFKDSFKIDFNDLKIITIVRNPYHRIISDLFFFDLIKIDSNPNFVYEKIIKFTTNVKTYDNHPLPQYLYLIDKNNNNELLKNLIILKTENLNNDMYNNGYTDFNLFEQVNKNKNLNYNSYLNNKSIKLINTLYEKDFEYFNYEMKKNRIKL